MFRLEKTGFRCMNESYLQLVLIRKYCLEEFFAVETRLLLQTPRPQNPQILQPDNVPSWICTPTCFRICPSCNLTLQMKHEIINFSFSSLLLFGFSFPPEVDRDADKVADKVADTDEVAELDDDGTIESQATIELEAPVIPVR